MDKLFSEKFAVAPKREVQLAKYDPDETLGFKKGRKAENLTAKTIARLDELQNLLWADRRHALLVVLQSQDAGEALRLNLSGSWNTDSKVP